ncbi:DUF805 domain-containing protein [Deefgea rivuli]|uniref:DUF805 domain-containing protein n=1 Tax=Deefgea rivuli TaxID=400948 RepID=UPI000484D71D|nr:DUF805 domain-containing protein [Deefgea rivuli]
MSDTIRLVLTGNFLPGVSPENATQSLAQLLKLDYAKAAHLLASAPSIIKKELPKAQLDTYLSLLGKVGVEVRAEAITPPVAKPKVPSEIPPLAVAPVMVIAEVETIACPSCGRQQPKRTLCLGCGCDMPRVLAAQAIPEPIISTVNRNNTTARTAAPIENDEEFATPALFELSFQGRLGRMRYLAQSVLMTLVIFIGALLMIFLSTFKPLLILAGLASLFAVAQCLRIAVLRLHDLNKPGSWVAWSCLAVIVAYFIDARLGAIFYGLMMLGSLALMSLEGNAGENDYGLPAEPPTLFIIIAGSIGIVISLLSLPSAFEKTDFNALSQHNKIDAEAEAANNDETETIDAEESSDNEIVAKKDPCREITAAERSEMVSAIQAEMSKIGLSMSQEQMDEILRKKLAELQRDCPAQ